MRFSAIFLISSMFFSLLLLVDKVNYRHLILLRPKFKAVSEPYKHLAENLQDIRFFFCFHANACSRCSFCLFLFFILTSIRHAKVPKHLRECFCRHAKAAKLFLNMFCQRAKAQKCFQKSLFLYAKATRHFWKMSCRHAKTQKHFRRSLLLYARATKYFWKIFCHHAKEENDCGICFLMPACLQQKHSSMHCLDNRACREAMRDCLPVVAASPYCRFRLREGIWPLTAPCRVSPAGIVRCNSPCTAPLPRAYRSRGVVLPVLLLRVPGPSHGRHT